MLYQDFEFPSWRELVDYAEQAAIDDTMRPNKARQGGLDIREDWQGVSSYSDVLNFARNGWKEGVSEAKKISDGLENRLTGYIERSDILYDVTGEVLDVGRYCAGDPEHWGVWHNTIVEGKGTKFVHVVVNGTASCSVDKEVMIRRGATLSAFIALMELGGYRVKVDLVIRCTSDGSYSSIISAPIKGFDEYLDHDKLTYAIAHPSVLRNLAFCIWDTIKDSGLFSGLGIGRWYGVPADVTGAARGDLYFRCMHGEDSTWETPERAERWLINELKKYEVLSKDFESD